MPYNVFVRRE
ncbi:hypothetical protein D030_2208A, partial [Vibrio parahaemolyticus AQ3810]